MCEAIGNLISGIPKNADKTLFAEDFVNHALRKYKLPELPSIADLYRPFVYNAFTPTMRDAASFLYKQLEMEILAEFHCIVEHRQLDRSSFENYVASVGTQYLGSGFNAEGLLLACVKITKMALKFHCNGLIEGPALVMQRIINILANYDMASGGWEQLNFIAMNYASLYAAVVKPPDWSESEYESGSVSNYSESNFSEVSTQEAASDTKHGKTWTQHSSVDDYSKASTSEARNDMPRLKFPSLPSTNLPSSSKSSGLVFNFDVLGTPSSSGEVKPGGVQRDIGSPGSIPMDGTVEYDSDVFEDNLEAVPPRANFRCHQATKKRPASSSSSAAGCPTLAAEERPDISSNSSASNPACKENLNAPLSANGGGTNDSISPDHEPSPKIRKQC